MGLTAFLISDSRFETVKGKRCKSSSFRTICPGRVCGCVLFSSFPPLQRPRVSFQKLRSRRWLLPLAPSRPSTRATTTAGLPQGVNVVHHSTTSPSRRRRSTVTSTTLCGPPTTPRPCFWCTDAARSLSLASSCWVCALPHLFAHAVPQHRRWQDVGGPDGGAQAPARAQVHGPRGRRRADGHHQHRQE